MTSTVGQIGQDAGNLCRRTVERQHAITVKVEHGS